MGCLGRDHRDGLDRRGAGADNADPQAGEIHALMRPVAGVVGVALETVQTGKSGIRAVDRQPVAITQ